MNNRVTEICRALCFLVPSFFLTAALPVHREALAGKQATVTDLAGRKVTLELPVKSFVLPGWSGSGNPFYTLFALLGDDAPKMIVGMDPGLKKNRHWIWEKFIERYPALEKIPTVGAPPEINVEKIIALKPDVVLAPVGAYKSGRDAFTTLEKAGIPVILNDYHSESLDTHIRSMQLIGQIVGRPQRTRELVDFYTRQCAVVQNRLAAAPPTNLRVYLELGQNPDEYKNTYGNSMWGLLVPRAHGLNIASGVVENYAPVSPEFVLKSNPQVVIFTGANWPSSPASLQLGYYADDREAQKRLSAFLARPGWSQMEAVKNSRVYGIHHGLAREIWDFYPLQCMAKWFYPEIFKDLDPLDGFRKFHEKFLGVSLCGTWSVETD